MANEIEQIVILGLLDKAIAMAKVQVDRGHFQEMYEGFNDCPAGPTNLGEGVCDCGYAEAEAFLIEAQTVLGESGINV
jgi:hypothetical protein